MNTLILFAQLNKPKISPVFEASVTANCESGNKQAKNVALKLNAAQQFGYSCVTLHSRYGSGFVTGGDDR